MDNRPPPLPHGNPTCHVCGGYMRIGLAIANTSVGVGDFDRDDVVTHSVGGQGRPVSVAKCVKCGHSEALA